MKEGSVNKKAEILIVEDEREIVENLCILLTEEGFSVRAATNRKAALEILEEKSADLILLDLMLPDGSGYSLCSAIKKERDIPVIMLTAMDDEASVVTGFDLGADDYVTKPFRPMELVSRIRNVLRRSEKGRCDTWPEIFLWMYSGRTWRKMERKFIFLRWSTGCC